MEYLFKVEEDVCGKFTLIDEFIFNVEECEYKFVKEQLRLISLLKKKNHFIEIKKLTKQDIVERNLNRCLKDLEEIENCSPLDLLARYSRKAYDEDVGRIDVSILNESKFQLSGLISEMQSKKEEISTKNVVKKIIDERKLQRR
jgi:hypothetical protein